MKTIITTVGTSIYSNLLKSEISDFYKKEYNNDLLSKKQYDIFNQKDKEKNKYDEGEFKDFEDNIFDLWMQNIKVIDNIPKNENNCYNFNCCAEIKTLNKIENFKELKHVLITTDTAISFSSAKLIKKFLIKKLEINEQNVKIEPIPGLQVHKPDKFKEEGINNLIKTIKKIKGNNKDVILNISGGYKALIPILTIIGQLENIPLKYIYEDSNKLIEIAEMPLQFNYQIIEDNLKTLKSISHKEIELNTFKNKLSKDKRQQEKLLKKLSSLLEIKFDRVKLSFLGDYILEKYSKFPDEDVRKSLYGAFIELQLFKYFVNKFGNNLIHSKKDEYEFDLYAKSNNKIFAVEVKSGGNVPLWEKKEGNKSLEYRIKEGAFYKILEENKTTEIEILIILYRAEELHPSLIKQINDLIKQNPEKTKSIKWLWLKSDGFENSNWSVDNRLTNILTNKKFILKTPKS